MEDSHKQSISKAITRYYENKRDVKLEKKIITMLSNGLSFKMVASEIGTTHHKVGLKIYRIGARMGTKNVVELVAKSLRSGYIE